MSHLKNTSPASPEERINLQDLKPKRHYTNWHEAAVCAVQIELRDYRHLLEFQSEYILGKNNYRIDLLIIRKLDSRPIPKNIADIFTCFNLFEVKGAGSSVNTDCYYKTIGYAGLFIDQTGRSNQYVNTDISLSFLCLHYPRALMKHLINDRKLSVAKFAPGVYHISKEIFPVQIIVTKELFPEDNLYLRCLTGKLQNPALVNMLADDYKAHQEQDIYRKYMDQLANANTRSKGESTMVCEGIFKICGTSSAEIIERTRKEEADYYLPKLNEQSAFIEELSSQINYLKKLLIENNIPFQAEAKTEPEPGQ